MDKIKNDKPENSTLSRKRTMRKRLILSRVEAGFDPETHLAFGPWCFSGAEDAYREWDKLDFVDALDKPEKLLEADSLTRRLANRYVAVWAGKLNHKHGTNHSLDYWRFVLINWLLVAVQGLWMRFLHAQSFISRHGEDDLDVEVSPLDPPTRLYGFWDFFHHQLYSRKFDFWTSSLIIRKLAPPNWKIHEQQDITAWNESEDDERFPKRVPLGRPSLLGKIVRSMIGRLSFDSVPGVTFEKVFFSLYLNLLPKKGRGRTYFHFDDDRVLKDFPKEFLEILGQFLEATLPIAYDTGYRELEEKAASEKVVPGRLYIGNLMPSDEFKRLILARALENGEKLVTVQHGSGYGASRLLCWSVEFEYPYHAFLTWGWREHENHPGNFIPLPSPMLKAFGEKHREANSALVMVAAKLEIRDIRLYGPRPKQLIKYRDQKLDFIDRLATLPRQNLKFFPYIRSQQDLLDEEYLQRHFHDLQIVRGGLNQEMLKARLVLLDKPGTSMNIAMAGNVPTVCYWDPKFYLISPQAVPFFDSLADCGILHDRPEAAADHVNAIWDDVAGWWESAPVQKARNAWKDQFARTGRFWWWPWIKTLTRLQMEDHPTAFEQSGDNGLTPKTLGQNTISHSVER